MRTHYLHLSAFTCEACSCPVISGSLATRATEIATNLISRSEYQEGNAGRVEFRSVFLG